MGVLVDSIGLMDGFTSGGVDGATGVGTDGVGADASGSVFSATGA